MSREAELEAEIKEVLEARYAVDDRLLALGEEEQTLRQERNELTGRMLHLDGVLVMLRTGAGKVADERDAGG